MSTRPQDQLHTLQRELYEKAFEEASSLATISSPRIAVYSRKFESSLPQDSRASSLKDVLEAINHSKLVLYGDFHTLKQSQRGLLRLIREYMETFPSSSCTLALEVFRHDDQLHLDRYLAGEINEEQLLEITNYEYDWGFPWKNYRTILDLARECSIRVVAINSPNAGRDSLLRRDRYAADILVKTAREDPDSTIFCMIGEYHLADEHLPQQLKTIPSGKKQDLRPVRILNNVDRYYFGSGRDYSHPNNEYLRLKDDFFCLLNAPPWIKWQSYTMWEEMKSVYHVKSTDEFIDDDQDEYPYTESTFDVDYHFLTVLKNLLTFMKLPNSGYRLDDFTIRSFPEDDFFNDLISQYGSTEVSHIVQRVAEDGFYVLGEENTIVLSRFSLNRFSEAAGQYLHLRNSEPGENPQGVMERFYRRVMRTCAGIVASKILNPKRKCPDYSYFQAYLALHRKRRLTGLARTKREIARAVVEHQTWIEDRITAKNGDFARPLTSLAQRDIDHHGAFSLAVGSCLGFELYTQVMRNQIPAHWLKAVFTSKVSSKSEVFDVIRHLYKLTTNKEEPVSSLTA